MSAHSVLTDLALLSLLFIFVIRTRSAMRSPVARVSWAASGIGFLALLARGTVIPMATMDAALGGTNLLNLTQNLLSTIAFWLMMQAVLLLGGGGIGGLRWWPLPIILVAFSAPFFYIADREGTSSTFIVDRVGDTAMWLYASIYMTGIFAVCLALLIQLRKRPLRSYALISLGAAAVAVGCMDEIMFLTTAHFQIGPAGLHRILHDLFDPFFYLGVVLIAVGISVFVAKKRVAEHRIRRSVTLLEGMLRDHGGVPSGTFKMSSATVPDVALLRLYGLSIALRDLENSGRANFDAHEQRGLVTAEGLIERHMIEPTAVDGPHYRQYLLGGAQP